MSEVAVAALTGGGAVHFTLAVFVLTWLVMVVLAVVSVVAVWRAASDLWHFRKDLRG